MAVTNLEQHQLFKERVARAASDTRSQLLTSTSVIEPVPVPTTVGDKAKYVERVSARYRVEYDALMVDATAVGSWGGVMERRSKSAVLIRAVDPREGHDARRPRPVAHSGVLRR